MNDAHDNEHDDTPAPSGAPLTPRETPAWAQDAAIEVERYIQRTLFGDDPYNRKELASLVQKHAPRSPALPPDVEKLVERVHEARIDFDGHWSLHPRSGLASDVIAALTGQADELARLRAENVELKRVFDADESGLAQRLAAAQQEVKSLKLKVDEVMLEWEGSEDTAISLRATIAAVTRERDELQKTIESCEHEVAEVYAALTNGKFSKMNTRAQVILDAVNEIQEADLATAREDAEKLAEALEELKRNTVEVILPNAKNLSLDIGQIALWDECVKQTDSSLAAHARLAAPGQE